MTLKKDFNAEGLRTFIEQRCTFIAGGHFVYTGPHEVQCNFKKMAVPRAWYLLNGKQIPAGKYLLNTCGLMGCIDCDHWALSHSPHSVAKEPARAPHDARTLRELRRALQSQRRNLEALARSCEASLAALDRLTAPSDSEPLGAVSEPSDQSD